MATEQVTIPKSKRPEYRIWTGMIHRCHNSKRNCYRYYGARGIVVCERWRLDFQAFLDDVGERPSPKYSLDRINNDGNYEPGNVRWADRTTQGRNTRANRILEFRGQRKCLTEWSEIVGISVGTIQFRLDEIGWSVERALTVPGVHNAKLTKCCNGHDFTAESSYVNFRGDRVCRLCTRARKKKYRDEKKGT